MIVKSNSNLLYYRHSCIFRQHILGLLSLGLKEKRWTNTPIDYGKSFFCYTWWNMSLKRLFKSSMKTVCKGVFKLKFTLCNLPLFLRQFLMYMMPKKKSMLLLVWYQKANLILNKTISIVNQIASTTITGIILNHTTLPALAISHHHTISMYLTTHHQHA